MGWRGRGFRGGWGPGYWGPGYVSYYDYAPCAECWGMPPALYRACLSYYGCISPGLGASTGEEKMSYSRNYQSLFSGLGQTKTASSTTGGKTGGSTQPDRTAQDWATGIQAGGSVISSIIGAATGQQPAATTTPAADPAATYTPPTPVTPDWYWPVVIGVGVTVLGGIAYLGVSAKRPVSANRRRGRRVRRNTVKKGKWIVPARGPTRLGTRGEAEKVARHLRHKDPITGKYAFDVKIEKEPSRSRPGKFAYQIYIRSTGHFPSLET